MKTNHIAIVIDDSGSMSSLRSKVCSMVNDVLKTIRERSEAEGQQSFISIVAFADSAKVVTYPTDIRSVRTLSPSDYRHGGSTALFDAVGEATKVIDRKVTIADDASFLVMVYTDGEENISMTYNASKIKKLIDEKQKTDRWTFAFQMPPGKGATFARGFGIPTENIREWEQTTKGVEEVRQTSTAAVSNYITSRSAGATRSKSFYVTTDMSNVDVKQVRKQLDDVTSRFKSIKVDKECTIQSLIEYKTGKYVIGSGFYQLMKDELIQKDKAILLVEKGTSTIYGGAAARKLIGLPDGQDAKVKPGNHSDWDIYAQSRSPNRKLVRGTKVLVDTGLQKGLPPTWDYLAAAATTAAKGRP